MTCDELIDAFNSAGWNGAIGVIVLTGAGTKAFCTGGDQSAHQGGYDGRGTVGLPMEALHAIIRTVPKPVIAKVRGYAIGGGNVLATLCDLTIAGESAQFGQVGPKVGSVDPGFGTAYLARVVGEKKAREIWYLCRRYSAHEALAMGLINKVVPDDQLDAEVSAWCREILERSPTAIAVAKRSFNADSDNIAGIAAMGLQALKACGLSTKSGNLIFVATPSSFQSKITATRGNPGQSLPYAGARAGVAVTIVVLHGNLLELSECRHLCQSG